MKCDNPKCDGYFWCGHEFCPNKPATNNKIKEFESLDED